MRAKFDAMLLHFANFGEAENLKAAAVGEDRLFPVHKLVQSVSGADYVKAGAQIQMVCVAENDLRVHLVQFARVERLDAGLRADGHEHRRLDDAVRVVNFPRRALVCESVLRSSNIVFWGGLGGLNFAGHRRTTSLENSSTFTFGASAVNYAARRSAMIPVSPGGR